MSNIGYIVLFHAEDGMEEEYQYARREDAEAHFDCVTGDADFADNYTRAFLTEYDYKTALEIVVKEK